MNKTQCTINKELGEKILFANGSKEEELKSQQEIHYDTCTNEGCIEIKSFLIEHNLFKMDTTRKAEYDEEQAHLEEQEDIQ